MERKKKNKILTFLIAVIFSIVIFPSITRAASLYFSPSYGTYNVGSEFYVSVYVSSTDQAMNAVSGIVSFPPDKLEVTSLSKCKSIVSFWVKDPYFSDNLGTGHFEGVVINPGYTGTMGKIVTIGFKVKSAGQAKLTFSSASVLANDGKGTNILTNLGTASFILSNSTQEEKETTIPKIETPSIFGGPSAPVIISSTHPDSNQWYSNSSPEFTWDVSPDIISDRLLVSKKSQAKPGVVYTPPINSKSISNLPDGVWYFYVQLRNKNGWGGIAQKRFLIDTQPPQPFQITINNHGDSTNPSPDLYFNTTDSVSGLKYYSVQIDDREYSPVTLGKNCHQGGFYYQIPAQKSGKHNVIVKVVDGANNETVETADFVVKPINHPVITDLPEKLIVGNTLIVKGKSDYPGATVRIFISKQGEIMASPMPYTTQVNQDGTWTYIHPNNLKEGVYEIWADVVDSRGAVSDATSRSTLRVTLPTFIKIGKIAINYLTVIITLLVLIIGIIFFIFYVWYKISSWRRRLRKETAEANKDIIRILRHLRNEIEQRIEYLDGKPGLNQEEKQMKKDLEKALAISRKSISKEIKDIDQDINKS